MDIQEKETKDLINLIKFAGNQTEETSLKLNGIACKTIYEYIEKKDKIINEMANEIYITAIRDEGTHFSTSQEVIDYFTNKVEEDK